MDFLNFIRYFKHFKLSVNNRCEYSSNKKLDIDLGKEEWCVRNENNEIVFLSLKDIDFVQMQYSRTIIIDNEYYILSKNENYDYIFEEFIEYNNKALYNLIIDSSIYLLNLLNKQNITIFLPHFIQKYEYNIEKNVERVYYDTFIKILNNIKEDEMIGNKLSKDNLPFIQELIKNSGIKNTTNDSNFIINTIIEIYGKIDLKLF